MFDHINCNGRYPLSWPDLRFGADAEDHRRGEQTVGRLTYSPNC